MHDRTEHSPDVRNLLSRSGESQGIWLKLRPWACRVRLSPGPWRVWEGSRPPAGSNPPGLLGLSKCQTSRLLERPKKRDATFRSPQASAGLVSPHSEYGWPGAHAAPPQRRPSARTETQEGNGSRQHDCLWLSHVPRAWAAVQQRKLTRYSRSSAQRRSRQTRSRWFGRSGFAQARPGAGQVSRSQLSDLVGNRAYCGGRRGRVSTEGKVWEGLVREEWSLRPPVQKPLNTGPGPGLGVRWEEIWRIAGVRPRGRSCPGGPDRSRSRAPCLVMGLSPAGPAARSGYWGVPSACGGSAAEVCALLGVASCAWSRASHLTTLTSSFGLWAGIALWIFYPGDGIGWALCSRLSSLPAASLSAFFHFLT